MPITIQANFVYTLLKIIKDQSLEKLTEAHLNQPTNMLLGHLDYLNQEGYIQAQFSGDAYADKGPNPLPSTVALQQAQLTEKGHTLLTEMEANPPQLSNADASPPVREQDLPFLIKVKEQAGLPDLYDARDLTVVVYRSMRDLLPTYAIDQIATDLGDKEAMQADEPALQQEIATLWQDTNPLVAWLSRLRPSFNNSGPLGVTDELFFRRIAQEGGLPAGVTAEAVIEAVFSATKQELPDDSSQLIAAILPGKVLQLWKQA